MSEASPLLSTGVAAIAGVVLGRVAAGTPLLDHLRATNPKTYDALMGAALVTALKVLEGHPEPEPRREDPAAAPYRLL